MKRLKKKKSPVLISSVERPSSTDNQTKTIQLSVQIVLSCNQSSGCYWSYSSRCCVNGTVNYELGDNGPFRMLSGFEGRVFWEIFAQFPHNSAYTGGPLACVKSSQLGSGAALRSWEDGWGEAEWLCWEGVWTFVAAQLKFQRREERFGLNWDA